MVQGILSRGGAGSPADLVRTVPDRRCARRDQKAGLPALGLRRRGRRPVCLPRPQRTRAPHRLRGGPRTGHRPGAGRGGAAGAERLGQPHPRPRSGRFRHRPQRPGDHAREKTVRPVLPPLLYLYRAACRAEGRRQDPRRGRSGRQESGNPVGQRRPGDPPENPERRDPDLHGTGRTL